VGAARSGVSVTRPAPKHGLVALLEAPRLGDLYSVTTPNDVLARLASRTSVRVSWEFQLLDPSTYRTGNEEVRSGAQVRGLAENLSRLITLPDGSASPRR